VDRDVRPHHMSGVMPPPGMMPPHGMMPPPGMGMPGMMPPPGMPGMGMPPPGMGPPPGMFPPGMPPPGMMPPGMGPPPGMHPPGMPPGFPGMPPGMPPFEGEGMEMMLTLPGMLATTEGHAEERPTKKRRLKGLDVPSLIKLLTGLHQSLEKLLESTGTKGEKATEAPVQHLEEEFERHWRLRFDSRAVGEPSTVSFLRRFPQVFTVRSNGFQVVVMPVEDPNFEVAAEVGIEQAADSSRDSMAKHQDFAVTFAEQVAAFLVNLVAEERKSGGAPLNFQYAQYEVVQDLLTRLKDGGAEDDKELVNALCDPKPPPREEPRRQVRHQEHDDRDQEHREPPRALENSAHDNRGDHREPPPRRRDDNPGQRYNSGHSGGYGDRGGGKGGKGGGRDQQQGFDKRGSDGRNLCRQFQSGRCTYGDNCRFLHEKDPDR